MTTDKYTGNTKVGLTSKVHWKHKNKTKQANAGNTELELS